MANRTFTINLEANATDLIKQFKAGSKELEKFAKGVAQAENKLEALQEAGAYLAQMDKALSQLSTKYPDVFNKVFGKVNAQIKKSLEPIAQSGAIIQKIGSQLEGISTGKLDATNTEMKQLGETVQALAKAMNVDINLDFLDGSGKAKTKAKQLIDVMAELTKSYSGVSAASSKSKTKKKEMPYEELSKTVEAIKLLSKKAGDGDDSAFDAMDRKISKLVKSFSLSEDGIAKLDVLLQNLDDSLDTTMSKLQVLLGEQFPTGQFDNLSTSAEDAKTNIDSLTSSIINAFNAADKLQRSGGRGNEIMNLVGAKGIISSAQGQDLAIDAGTMVNQLLANLKESIVMSLHDHPNASDAFTPSDIESYAKLYYGQGTKLHGIIANGVIQTIDFNGISQELAIKIAESYSRNISEALMNSEFFDFKDGNIIPKDAFNKLDVGNQEELMDALIPELNDALDKAFVDNGLESTVRQWAKGEIPQLVQYLQQLGASAQEAISPLEKLKNLFATYNSGNQIDWSNFTVILDQFSSGAIDASTALEMMLNKMKELKQAATGVSSGAGIDPAKVREGTVAIEEQTDALRERNRVEEALEKEVKAEQRADSMAEESKSDLPRDTVDTSAEVGDLEQLRMKLEEIKSAIVAKTDAFTNEGQTVNSVVTTEVQNLEQLRAKIEEVNAAIKLKTDSFTAEGQTVSSVVAEEIASLERLQAKLSEISAVVGGIGKINLGADGNAVPAVSPSSNVDNQAAKEVKIEGTEELKASIGSLQKTIESAISVIKPSKGGHKSDVTTAKPEKKKFKDQTIRYGKAAGSGLIEADDNDEERRIKKIFDYYYWIEEQLAKFPNNKLYKQALENVQERLKPDIDKFYEKLGDNAEPYWLDSLNRTHDLHLAQIKGGQAYSDSINTEKKALGLLQEEWKLRQEIFSLQQKGATEEDLGPLQERVNLLSDLRKVIEEGMTPEEAARYGASATKIQGAGESKMTVAEVRAELKKRLDAEKAAIKAQQAAQKKAESEAQKFNLVGKKNELSWIKDSVDFKSTGIDRATTDSYARQVIEAYDELIGKISVFSSLDREITAEEMAGLRDSAAAVREKIKAYNFLADAKAKAKEFTDGKDAALKSLNDYSDSLNWNFVSEDSVTKLAELETRLNSITDNNGLEKWKRDFVSLTESISRATNEAEQLVLALQGRKLQGIKNSATSSYKAAGIDPDNMTDGQKELSKSYDELMAKLEVYAKRRGQISDDEMADLERIAAKIKEQASGYELQAKNNAIEKSGQSKLATLIGSAKNAGIADSDMGAAAINKAREAWDAYAAALKNMPKNPTLDDEIAVQQLAAAYDNATAELKELIKETNNFSRKAVWNKSVDGVDINDRNARASALEGMIREQTEGSKIKLGQLSSDGYSLDYSVQNADKSWSRFTATLNKAGTSITAINSKVKTTDGLFKSLISGSLDKMKNALQVFSGYDLFFRGIEEIRRGVQYITEIDTALTELKKVTDETDATYNQFLQTMSKTGAAIGATVSNLTTMAADWARLGYSIEEAGALAESTAILLNVSEFTSAEDASSALISTMQAFGYAAEDSMRVVDVLNEIGKIYCL